MTYTKLPPLVPGFYWMRQNGIERIVWVRLAGGSDPVYSRHGVEGEYSCQWAIDDGAEFSGPVKNDS